MKSRTLLFSLAAASGAHAYGIQNDISFGQSGQHVWTDDHRHVHGFEVSGADGHHPDLLSDRLMLTPPWPGNKRGAVWAEYPEPDEDWAISTEFRVSGPESGSGNFQIWYVRDKHEVNTNSVYTVGKFDGLAILVDTHGHRGGEVRAFLNDGHKHYDSHHLDKQAFGHCNFNYRNTGHFVNIQVHNLHEGFEILVDGHRCVEHKQIKLPPHSYFGLTAASGATADSVEVRNFIAHGSTTSVTSSSHHDGAESGVYHDTHHADPANIHGTHPPPHQRADPHDQYSNKDWYWEEHGKDTPASDYTTDKERFTEMHDKIQMTIHQLDVMFHDLTVLKQDVELKHHELITWLAPIHDYVTQSKSMIERIDKQVEGEEFKDAIHQLSTLVAESHHTLLHGIPMSLHTSMGKRMGFVIFVFVAFQVMLAGSYFVYVKRKNAQPKKYL